MDYAFDGAPYTIFDSGTSHLMVPSLLFQPILDNIIEATRNPLTNTTASYKVSSGTVIIPCNQRKNFKEIKLMFQ
jgi:hypothetical protein